MYYPSNIEPIFINSIISIEMQKSNNLVPFFSPSLSVL